MLMWYSGLCIEVGHAYVVQWAVHRVGGGHAYVVQWAVHRVGTCLCGTVGCA